MAVEEHRLCVPDEADAITAANAWLAGRPPAGRHYKCGADTSGYAIGEVFGQCDAKTGKLRPQQHWHSYGQELHGLLHVKRDKNKQLGRTPNVNHTDHANLARLESMDLSQVEPKHYRWFQEIVSDGSLLLHRPGVSAMHKGPDRISRNPEGRGQLILDKAADLRRLPEAS